MAIVTVVAVAATVIGVWAFLSDTLLLSKENALLCRNVLFVLSCLGTVAAILTFILYNIFAKGDNVPFAKESFNILALCLFVFWALGALVASFSVILKNRMRKTAPIALALWALILIFSGFFGGLFLSFTDASAYFYLVSFAVSLGAMLSFPSFLELRDRTATLSDRESRQAIIDSRNETRAVRRAKRLRKKHIREKKKRLKKGK